jgi:hypothetical protein
MSDHSQVALHGPYTKHNQVCIPISGTFQNPLGRRSVQLAEFDLAFRFTPWLGLRRDEFLQTAQHGRDDVLQVEDPRGGLPNHV